MASKFANLSIAGGMSAIIGGALFTLVTMLYVWMFEGSGPAEHASIHLGGIVWFFVCHTAYALKVGWPIFLILMPLMFTYVDRSDIKATIGNLTFSIFGSFVSIGILMYGYFGGFSILRLLHPENSELKAAICAAIGGFLGGRAFWKIAKNITQDRSMKFRA